MLRAGPPTSAGRIAEVEPGRRREKGSRASPSGASVQRRGEREREALPDRPDRDAGDRSARLRHRSNRSGRSWFRACPAWIAARRRHAKWNRESTAVLYLWLLCSVLPREQIFFFFEEMSRSFFFFEEMSRSFYLVACILHGHWRAWLPRYRMRSSAGTRVVGVSPEPASADVSG